MSGINLLETRVRSSRTFSSVSCETSKPIRCINDIGNSSKPSEQIGKRRSRVSLMISQLESSLIKEYKDLMCENYEHNDSFLDMSDEVRSISFNSVTKEVQVKINYEILVNEHSVMFTHELSVTNETYISDLIRMAIGAFNEHYHDIKHEDGSIDKVSLMTSDYTKYELKASKKNGKAKDVPAFCLDTTIHNAQTTSYSLLLKKNDCLIVTNVKEKTEDERETKKKLSIESSNRDNDDSDKYNDSKDNNNKVIIRKKKNSCSIM